MAEKRILKISYCISVCNEDKELDLLLNTLFENIDRDDEICILGDDEKITSEVLNVINDYSVKFNHFNFIRFPLNNDFASFKNKFFDLVSGDYIFFLDADEIPNFDLINDIKPILILNPGIDTFLIPRENRVEGIGLSHIKKWNWNISKGNLKEERELDLNNPKDLDHYNLLKKYNLIIEENILLK